MITPREIYKDLEGTRQRMKQNITPEDIDVIFDLLKDFYERVDLLSKAEIKSRTAYQKLYCQVHNIPDGAIVEWR